MASDTSVFGSIWRMDPHGVESWSSRDFAPALGSQETANRPLFYDVVVFYGVVEP